MTLSREPTYRQAYQQTYQRTHRAARQAAGLCPVCGELNDGPFYLCTKCRQHDAALRRSPTRRRTARDYAAKKTANDIQYRLGQTISSRLNQAVKRGKKSGQTIRELGCTLIELKSHLEKLFAPGMNGTNYGQGTGKWNIDHEIPLSNGDLEDREWRLKVSHYTNVRPLWSADNSRKGNRLEPRT